jgi:hypothetical protein
VTESSEPIPPGWYPDPASNDDSVLRWWTGAVWSDQVSVERARPPRQPRGDEPDAVVRPSRSSRLALPSHILEAGTLFLVVLAHTLELLLLGLFISAATLVVEVFATRWRRRQGTLSIGVTVLSVVIGSLGFVWFAFVLIAANVITVERLGH